MENKQTNNPSRSELITNFVKTNPNYYIKEFQKNLFELGYKLQFVSLAGFHSLDSSMYELAKD